jgi:hypothetical protein
MTLIAPSWCFHAVSLLRRMSYQYVTQGANFEWHLSLVDLKPSKKSSQFLGRDLFGADIKNRDYIPLARFIY